MMMFGMGELRLAPAAFWAMTPRELSAMAGASSGAPSSPPSRDEFQQLMQRYPDEESANE
jgi:uncharacterized phage protein (TIGR02216 family)